MLIIAQDLVIVLGGGVLLLSGILEHNLIHMSIGGAVEIFGLLTLFFDATRGK